ncbi:MAG: S8 family serine peptidase, partial [Thermoplasmata archaeon]
MKGMKRTRIWAIASVLMLLISVFAVGMVLSSNIDIAEEEAVVLIYKRGITAEELMSTDDISVLADYEEFSLVSMSIGNKNTLLAQGYQLYALENRDEVSVHSGTFYVNNGVPDLPSELRVDRVPEGVRRPYIVQFVGPIMQDWQDQLADMGVVLHSYRHGYNLVVEMDRDTAQSVEKLGFVNWVGIYQPAYKFDHTLLRSSESIDMEIYPFATADSRAVAQKIASFTEIAYIVDGKIVASVSPEDLGCIAGINGVHYMNQGFFEYELLNHHATWITQTSVQDYRKVTDLGVVGNGQLVTVMDSELFVTHEMFADSEPIGPTHRKIEDMYAPNRGDIGEGVYHGTHVTGSVLGDAPPYGEYNKHDGNGMGARVIFQDIGREGGQLSPPTDMTADGWGPSYDAGSRVITNSWGSPVGGYSGLAVESDQFIWDHKDYTILWAAGNAGPDADSLSSQPHSKNAISVGATMNYPMHDNMAEFSSRGYAKDGRIKPTLLGVGIVTSSERSEDGYATMGGTSMSTPGIAGQVSQVRQYYEEGWYPMGYANPGDGFNPSNALVKATMINGAREISGDGAYHNGNEFPSADQGFGRSELDRSLYFEWDERSSLIFDSWNDVELETGQSWSMDFDIVDPTQELEATLVWSDYPGEGGVGSIHIVNDLDLELFAPGGDRYVGNAYTGYNPGYSQPNPTTNRFNGPRTGEWDGLNVEENILLLPDHNDVETGTYTLTVTAHNVPTGPQDFAVVVSGGLEPAMEEGDPPTMTITSPAGGETWSHGDTESITWTSTQGDDPIDYVDLRYSIDGGDSWHDIVSEQSDSGSFSWTIPNVQSDDCIVQGRIVDTVGRYAMDESGTFTIAGSPPSPPSSLDVEVGGGATVVTFDDFADGNYDGWEVLNGSWDASEGYLQGYGKIATPAVMDGEDLDAYGTWEFDFQFTAMENTGNTAEDHQIMRFYFIIDGDPSATSGYSMTLTGESAGGYQANLWALENGDPIGTTSLIQGMWGGGTQVSTLRVERDTNNEFTVYVDGDLIGSVVDDTYTNTDYIGFEHNANPVEGGDPHIVHEVGVMTEIEGQPHNFVDWQASPDEPDEVSHYNVYRSDMQAGAYDQISTVPADGSPDYRYVDEYKGEDDAILWWYIVRAVGINGLEEENNNAVQEPGTVPPDTYTLTVNTDGDGTVDIDPDQAEYEEGTTVELTATPASGWEFVEWTGDATGTSSTTTVTMDDDKTVTAVFEEIPPEMYTLTVNIDGDGTVDVDPDQAEYEEGTSVELTATPASGWEFVEWTGDATGTSSTTTVTMDDDKTVTAVFETEQVVYDLIIDSTSGGEVTEPGEGTFDRIEGTEVDLVAVAESGYEFVEWTGDVGTIDDTSTAETTITMNDDYSITAVFETDLEEYTLTIDSTSGGDVTDPGEGEYGYVEDSVVDLVAEPRDSYYFVEWTGDIDTIADATSAETTITMDDDYSITAVFETDEDEVELTIEVDGDGTTDPQVGTHSYVEGEEATITATAADGWEFVEWTGDATGTDTTTTVTMDSDKTVTAVFQEEEVVVDTYTLTVNTDGDGSVDVDPNENEYDDGTTVTLTANPASGWEFVEWTGGASGTNTETTVTMNSDKTV